MMARGVEKYKMSIVTLAEMDYIHANGQTNLMKKSDAQMSVNSEACRQEGRSLAEIGDLYEKRYTQKRNRRVSALTGCADHRFNNFKINKTVKEIKRDESANMKTNTLPVARQCSKSGIFTGWLERQLKLCCGIFKSTTNIVVERGCLVRSLSYFLL